MFYRSTLCAALAGVAAALLLTLAQAVWLTPLILQAETYEQAAEHSAAAEAHGAWQPEDGWQRSLSTAVGNGVLGVGYGLMLVGLYRWRRPSGMEQGLLWGIAGYAAFFLLPGLGLPPELPGTAAAALSARQYWWLGTALASSVGLGLLFLQCRWSWRGAGLLLLAVPHAIGAPQPGWPASLAPEALQSQFYQASLLCNALFWAMLGAVSAGLFARWHDGR